MRTPVDPLQPLSRTLSPVFLGVFLPVSQGVLSANHPRPRDSKPKPPDQNDTSPALRPSAWERCRFYGFFWHISGGGGGRLGGLGWCRKRGFREGAEGQKKGFRGEKEKGD